MIIVYLVKIDPLRLAYLEFFTNRQIDVTFIPVVFISLVMSGFGEYLFLLISLCVCVCVCVRK